MMEKFDSIYADSVNDEIEFDIMFNSEEDGSLIESVDPDKFYTESGDEKEIVDDIEDDIDDDDDYDDYDDDEDDDDKCDRKCSKKDSKSMGDLDDLMDEYDDEEEMDECGDDYYGHNHDYDDDDHDVRRYHDNNDKDCRFVDKRDINTMDDLDRRMDTYNQKTDDYDKQVVHSGEVDSDEEIYPRQRYTDDRREINTMDDLDRRMDSYPIREDEEEDGRLIDKVDNDGAPSDEATPEDFYRPEDNYQDNSFETRGELKEAKTMGDLEDTLATEFDNTNNVGLESEESINPASDESFEDGEDIDAVIGESFEDFIRRYS